MDHSSDAERENLRVQAHQYIKELFGIEDTRGVDLFFTLNRVSHMVEALDSQSSGEHDLSGPRWRLLMRLFISEQKGHPAGLTPTVLSRSQRVSKNTISALLRGLEEKGLIQRTTDPNDLRIFRIQLTQAGRQFILSSAPERIAGLNSMLSGLQPAEVEQLTLLLNKLHASLIERIHQRKNNPLPDGVEPDC